MLEYLDICPGSVSVMGLMNDPENHVQLLMDGQLTVPETLLDCSVVGVKFAAMTYNNVQHRNEPVFAVTDVSGQFQGHYFASAFKSLTL